MDQLEEKKWFVFVGDHHEGPFSMMEMQGKLETRAIGLSNYVWADGMDDWRVMSEVPAFGTPDPKPEPIPTSIQEPAQEPEVAPAQNRVDRMNIEPDTDPRVLAKPKNKTPAIFAAAVVAVVLAAGGGVYYFKDTLFPPIPRVETVSAEDNASLKAAAGASLDAHGPTLAIALSNENAQRPIFYVATNLPDGATFDLYFEGLPATLLGQLHATTHTSVVVSKKLGKTSPVMLSVDKDLPLGEYEVYAAESETQPDEVKSLLAKAQPQSAAGTQGLSPNTKLLAKKMVFLGGAKDSGYTQKLSEFHTKLQEKARLEIAELKQLTGVIESQLQETSARFEEARKSKSKRGGWGKFNESWITKEAPVAEPFQKTTPEVFHSEYLHAELYDSLKQVDQDVQRLHNLQNEFFSKNNSQSAADEIQLGEAAAMSQGALLELKSKIDQAEKSPSPI